MRRFSAQYTITNLTPPLKRAIITTEDDGTIINIKDTGGNLKEDSSVEFYNGILIPGFVNCHCHLELSHMKGSVSKGGGLGHFLRDIKELRYDNSETIADSASKANNEMCKNGIVLCADICNTSSTFDLKKNSNISYFNLLEVFGTDPGIAQSRIDAISIVAEEAAKMNMPFSLVPHTAYSVSLSLFRLLKQRSLLNRVTSMHFMETSGEKSFLESHSGHLIDSFIESGLIPSQLQTVVSHAEAVLNEVTPSGNLILVHNTFADRDTVRKVMKRGRLSWCLCPNSNIYIEGDLPPVQMLIEEGCEIVIGTDSLASNTSLSILDELKTLQQHFPDLTVMQLINWATLNGARALGEENSFGILAEGKRPGILLVQNADLLNMKLLPESFVNRLI